MFRVMTGRLSQLIEPDDDAGTRCETMDGIADWLRARQDKKGLVRIDAFSPDGRQFNVTFAFGPLRRALDALPTVQRQFDQAMAPRG